MTCYILIADNTIINYVLSLYQNFYYYFHYMRSLCIYLSCFLLPFLSLSLFSLLHEARTVFLMRIKIFTAFWKKRKKKENVEIYAAVHLFKFIHTKKKKGKENQRNNKITFIRSFIILMQYLFASQYVI